MKKVKRPSLISAKNIITYVLDSKEFFRISKCESAREMWDTLKETHESTTEMKKSKTRRKRRQNKKGLNLCFMAKKEDDSSSGNLMESMQQWYLDSGCSKHMTGDKSNFVSITFKQEGHVTYGDNNKGRILGRGSIGDKSILIIHDVLYVEGPKHNLLNISQLCDKGYQVVFVLSMMNLGYGIEESLTFT
ncbi:uncharacterized protein [Phaseolus vulgaris]|uniref:uncharacterized protein n=1 Tax=Phaseolus vulgaris TaxID=3885 RepID=UPI0035C9E9C6